MKCSQCGFDDSTAPVKPYKNAMNHYVRKSDGLNGGMFNDDAVEISVGKEDKKEVYILKSKYVAPAAKPVTPATK